MKTLRLKADPDAPECRDLLLAAQILRDGGTVAFATETVYGLGANALSAEAVAKIFAAKQRPSWDPLIVHIADEAALPTVASSVSPAGRAWIQHLWPGPLTLLLPRSAAIPDAVTAGRAKVGVRMPAHPVARALIRAAGVPLAAPSANTFGHVSPTSAAHVAADLDGRIDAILDSGSTLHGLESSVVDPGVEPCILYRPGAVTIEQLRAVWPSVCAYAEPAASVTPAALPSPGVGMRHYAPRARLLLVDCDADQPCAALGEAVERALREGARVGVMLPRACRLAPHAAEASYATEISPAARASPALGATAVFEWGNWEDAAELGRRLFAGLRALDDAAVEAIVCPAPTGDGLRIAILDRLRKAARRE